MKRNQYVNRKGETIYTDSDIVPDGCSIRTSVMLMDSLDDVQREIAGTSRPVHFTDALGRSHQPGHRLINTTPNNLRDAAIDARDVAYAELEKRSAAAWRTNVAVAQTNAASGSSFEVAKLSPADARDSAFAELEKRSANAWRGGR